MISLESLSTLNRWFYKYLVYYPVVFVRFQDVPFYLKLLLETQKWPEKRIAALQKWKLQNLLEEASKNVPFYSRAPIKTKSYRGGRPLALNVFPFMSKDVVREAEKELRSRRFFPFLTRKTTGGSTGKAITIYKSARAMAWELAATWRGYSWAGVSIGDRQGRLWGVPFTKGQKFRAKTIDLIAHRKRCSAFSFDEESLKRYTRALEKFAPDYLYGYVSMIDEYAGYFHRHAAAPPFRVRSIITTSEVLTEVHRKRIQETFSARVYNEYGCGEVGSIAHECREGSMHIMAENMMIEIVDGERVCRPGEFGEIVVTELNNAAMPLIRYRTGDLGSIDPRRCNCGSTLPVLSDVVGRAYDTLRNPAGKLFHGEFFMYIFEEAEKRRMGVKAFQVVQETPSSLLIRIVPGRAYSPSSEDFITARIRRDFDPHIEVRFERVDHIERLPSGKMRLIVGYRPIANGARGIEIGRA